MDNILEFKPNTRDYVRQINGFGEAEKLKQAISILDQWTRKQNHFTKKEYDEEYLENLLIYAKGSIEKAKYSLENMCIMRTLLPKYFKFTDIRRDFRNILTTSIAGPPLPKLTEEHYRIVVFVLSNDNCFKSLTTFMDYYKFFLIMFEYLKRYDCCAGYIMIFDISKVSIMDVIAKFNVINFKQMFTFLLEGQSMRLKSMIFISPSKAVESFIKLIKPVFSKKMADRINVYPDYEDLHKDIPRDILPADMGGKEKPLRCLQEDWINKLCEKGSLEYLRGMHVARVDENHKKIDKMCQFADMAGSYVALNID